jgi:hypothetical protein
MMAMVDKATPGWLFLCRYAADIQVYSRVWRRVGGITCEQGGDEGTVALENGDGVSFHVKDQAVVAVVV